jgi:AAA ATPase domain
MMEVMSPPAVPPGHAPNTLADRLAEARRAHFVGRAEERARFMRMLRGVAEPVWFLHGPGGIGKSTLLRELAREAEACERIVLQIDARHVPATPEGWRQALAAALHAEDANLPPPGCVLLVDTFESIATLEPWLRDDELPRYPGDVIVVLAGRTPADAQWRLDAGWSTVAAVTRLLPFSEAESQDYLAARLAGRAVPQQLLAQGRGYPLLLALLADAERYGRGAALPAAPEGDALVRELLARFAGELRDPLRRSAFDLLIVARTVNLPMLAEVVDVVAAPALLGWLRTLPFVEAAELHVQVHDVVRESFAVAWTDPDPDEIGRLRLRAMQHTVRRLARVGNHETARLLKDWLFLMRHTPAGPHLDQAALESHRLDAMAPQADAPRIEALARARHGEAALALVRHWLHAAPDAFVIVRRHDGAFAGALLVIELTRASAEALAGDPLAEAAWHHVLATRKPRPGGSVWLARLTLDERSEGVPNAAFSLGAMRVTRRALLEANAEWTLLVHADPARMEPVYRSFSRINWAHRVPALDHRLGNECWGVFARDYVTEPVPPEWRALQAPGQGSRVSVLGQDAFAAAVKDALRHYAREDKLAASPLLACHWLDGGDSAARVAALRERLRQAVQALAEHPADAKFHHALRLTWLDPGTSQERVAEELGLPFNTYRYHLARGTDRVVQALWQRELQPVPLLTPFAAT